MSDMHLKEEKTNNTRILIHGTQFMSLGFFSPFLTAYSLIYIMNGSERKKK